ncbi:MAG: hypothetical protein Q7S39_08635 [Ignavibacteria bacterium]|nr:hypothetical protein [Ignavibacteria bacterium]
MPKLKEKIFTLFKREKGITYNPYPSLDLDPITHFPYRFFFRKIDIQGENADCNLWLNKRGTLLAKLQRDKKAYRLFRKIAKKKKLHPAFDFDKIIDLLKKNIQFQNNLFYIFFCKKFF